MNGAADSNLWQPGVEACLDAAHPCQGPSLLSLSLTVRGSTEDHSENLSKVSHRLP